MKLLKCKEIRIVKYIDGIVLEGTPDWVEYIATDADGSVYGYDIEPYQGANKWIAENEYELLANVDLEGMDWGDTLIEIN